MLIKHIKHIMQWLHICIDARFHLTLDPDDKSQPDNKEHFADSRNVQEASLGQMQLEAWSSVSD